ncbi:hypothetical protein HSX37_13095|uniref:hypothetical protein n=1 Tax=Dendrosporobacter quercicolus TaxID=146817 RepID=UPI001570ABFD|nr:hypothetical protein [Dendrosporobacter quercicolus]NSL48970.1 hypothetical protein [Dendrosporobacter quercicolus DSM 1736]
MDTVILLLVLASGIHAFTYSRWLIHNGNKAGGVSVYVIILIGLALPVYRLLTHP